MKMSELKAKDPAMYKAIHDKWNKKKDERKVALAAVLAYAMASTDEKVKAFAASLQPKAGGAPAGVKAPSYLTVLNEMFKDKAFIHEDAVFKNFRLGRSEMRKYTVQAIKNAKPDERLWVWFDVASGLYKLEGKGKDAPKDWKGYKPLVVDGAEVK